MFKEIEENCSRVGIMNKGKIVYVVNLKTRKKKKEFVNIYPIFKKHIKK
jgi:ABC-type multidrug transport system ATPase subunit